MVAAFSSQDQGLLFPCSCPLCSEVSSFHGCHGLPIAIGRRFGVPRAARVCPHCHDGSVGGKLYMIFECAFLQLVTNTVCKPVSRQHPINVPVQSSRLWGHFGLCFVLFDAAWCLTYCCGSRPSTGDDAQLGWPKSVKCLPLCCLVFLLTIMLGKDVVVSFPAVAGHHTG